MKWYNNLKVAWKVLIAALVFIVMLLGVGLSGFVALNSSSKNFQTFYNGHFMPLIYLDAVAQRVLQIRINMLQEQIGAINGDWNEVNARFKSTELIGKEYKTNWDAFMATEMSSEKKKLAERLGRELSSASAVRKEFKTAIINRDLELGDKKLAEWLEEYRAVRKTLIELVNYESSSGKIILEEQKQTSGATRLLILVIIAVSIIFGILLTVILSRAISSPVKKGLQFAKEIANGDFRNRIDLEQKDELGELGKALNAAADDLERTISDILAGMESLNQAALEISSGNENLSSRTSEQASSLEEIASIIEESTATINTNAENSNKANNLSKDATSLAQTGGDIMDEALSSINDINDSSKKIEEIITVINEISFQTNLLALNAAVEAARAGEQGRGFAVVAGEVRNLAQRSGSAAKEIGELINESIDRVEKGTGLTNL